MFLFTDVASELLTFDNWAALVTGKNQLGLLTHNIGITHNGFGNGFSNNLNVSFCLNIIAENQYQSDTHLLFASLSGQEQVSLKIKTQPSQTERARTGMHQHDYFELMYVFKGAVEQYLEDGFYLYREGEASLLNRNVRHYERFQPDSIVVFLCFSIDYVDNQLLPNVTTAQKKAIVFDFFYRNSQETTYYKKEYLSFKRKHQQKQQRLINDLVEEMMMELLNGQVGYRYILLGLHYRFFAAMTNSDYRVERIILDSTKQAYLFNRITSYMESQEGRVNRQELAKHLQYNGDYLNRIVKQHTGMSISAYNHIVCLKKAESLLITTNMSVSEIIIQLGYENKSYFYKLFKKRNQVTPLVYRSRYHK